VLLLLMGGCSRPARTGEHAETAATRASVSAPASIDSAADVVDARIPRAAAGDSGWRYAQVASSDLDGDGVVEMAWLISDVTLDRRGRPLWEDGHRWQVYVEEPDRTRSYAYSRFLPMGRLEAALARARPSERQSILLIERTPSAFGVYEVHYDGPGRLRVTRSLERTLESRGGFETSPVP
jgi:hypothetical protein